MLTLSVTTTYLAEPVGDKPPFRELAIGEIQVIGAAVGDSSIPTDTTTSMATAEANAADGTPGK